MQERVINIFDIRTKAKYFYLGKKVLKWDSKREDKVKVGKIDFLRKWPMSFMLIEEIMLSF